MSESFDKMKQVRLTPQNLQSLQELKGRFKVNVSLAAIANRCVELGLPLFEKENPALKQTVKKP